MKINKITAAIIVAALIASTAPMAFGSSVLKKAVVGAAGGYVVNATAPQLNDFINKITLQKGVKYEGYTKVVPILSVGNGTKIGAAQIGSESKQRLDQTKCVARLEGEFNRIGCQALIPIDSTNPTKGMRRVRGVGVTAIIDVKL